MAGKFDYLKYHVVQSITDRTGLNPVSAMITSVRGDEITISADRTTREFDFAQFTITIYVVGVGDLRGLYNGSSGYGFKIKLSDHNMN
jgi:hypothetical protein